VNASAIQFRDFSLVDDVEQALDRSGLDGSLLIIEITESVLMDNTERAADILTQIATLGVRVAIDDFGTGYSSLAYLREFSVDILKIDRTFVSELTEPRLEKVGLAETILALSESLGVDTIAEGVELPAQADHLRALHCDYAQGFLFARPTEPAAFAELLEGPSLVAPSP
jgi:EAL domain-containing protein (putative c-di-GMP-specific phosphodiesterase class I)